MAGAKLAGRKPDREHPFGHGRIEYLSAMIIAAIVFYAGLTSLWESGKKIFEPEPADYSLLSLFIIAVAVLVKIVLGRYFKQQGKAAESGALVASGADALFDAVLSFSVLASALIYLGTGVSLEAYVGVIIAIFILKSGIDMMRDTLNDILGERPYSSAGSRACWRPSRKSAGPTTSCSTITARGAITRRCISSCPIP